MKRRYSRYSATAPVAVACVLAACAPMTEEEREAREYSRVEFQNQFVLDQTRCHERGGRIEVAGDAVRIDRDGIPYARTRYICVLRGS